MTRKQTIIIPPSRVEWTENPNQNQEKKIVTENKKKSFVSLLTKENLLSRSVWVCSLFVYCPVYFGLGVGQSVFWWPLKPQFSHHIRRSAVSVNPGWRFKRRLSDSTQQFHVASHRFLRCSPAVNFASCLNLTFASLALMSVSIRHSSNHFWRAWNASSTLACLFASISSLIVFFRAFPRSSIASLRPLSAGVSFAGVRIPLPAFVSHELGWSVVLGS